MGYSIRLIDSVRLVLLSGAWICAIAQILFEERAVNFINFGVILYIIFILMTLPKLRPSTFLILLFLSFIGWLFMKKIPSFSDWMASGRYALIFCALIPTMALVRATALIMPSVNQTQKQLANLPPNTSASGFQLAAHFFGGVLNLGVVPILSAAVPENSSFETRRAAAEATLRGMVTAATWSPFFIAFAIGQKFTSNLDSWIAISIGVFTAIIFTFGTLPYINKSFKNLQIKASIRCLKPVLFRLMIALTSVLIVALLFDYTALSAVILVMPGLVLLQLIRNSKGFKVVVASTKNSMVNISDDIVIISMAMVVAFFATEAGVFSEVVSTFYSGIIPGWVALILTPTIMMVASIIGIHPVISSTALLGIFSGGAADVHPALLMQSHLIGWGAGTLPSFASLALITCSRLFVVPVYKLTFGINLWISFGYALIGGILLSLVNIFI